MLNITLYNNVLQVEQIIMSFTDTKKELYSFDLKNGTRWEGGYDAPERYKVTKALITEEKLKHIIKYYLPKVKTAAYERKYRLTGEIGKRRVYVLKCGVWSRIGLGEFEQIQINGIVFESHNIDKYKYFTEYLFYTKGND